MARYRRTEGICLRRVHYSNTSQVACLLTPDCGRLSFMAKGVTRAPKRGIRTGFDLLGRYEIVYAARRPGGLQNLTYRWLIEDFRGIRRRMERLLCAYYAAELALNFTVEGDPCPELYGLLVETLRRFAAGRALALNVARLELGALRAHGSCPAFDRCVGCGGRLPARGAVLFSAAEGGPLCRRCEAELRTARRPDATVVRAGTLKALAALDPDTTGPADAREPAGSGAAAMSEVLRFQMRYLLGKELRMWPYLAGRRLSRALGRRGRRAARRGS